MTGPNEREDYLGFGDGFTANPRVREDCESRIEQLEAALEWIVGCAMTEPGLMVAKARAALEGK